MENEDRHIEELLNDLIQRPSDEFPKKGSTKAVGVPPSPGVYVVFSPTGSVVHVGRTQRGRGGLQQRLDNHLYGQSSFAEKYLKPPPHRDLRRGYKFRYLVVQKDKERAFLEALAIGKLCPKHLGLGEKARQRRHTKH